MEQIELRSEKIRNIIGQIPPQIIRYGISVLFIVFVLLLTLSYFFKYTYSINTTIILKKENGKLIGQIKIPANEIPKVKIGYTVRISFNNIPKMTDEYIDSRIIEVPKTIEISKSEAYSYSIIQLTDSLLSNKGNKICISENLTTNAIIFTEKISFFERIIQPFKSLIFQNDLKESL